MFPDEYETIEVYKASAVKSIINDTSALLSKSEYENRVLTEKVEKLEHTLEKLIAILPPEMKLAFELIEVEKKPEE